MGALAVKEKLASGQKTSVDAIRINAVASLVADLHREKTAANDDTASAALDVWSWEGEACGATAPTGSVTINLRFPGQYYDTESGLHYNWNRYYDPKLCRYVSSDPIGLDGGSNTYTYAFNNPLIWLDPLGLRVVLGQITRISTATITPGIDDINLSLVRSSTIEYYINIPDCFIKKSEKTFPKFINGTKWHDPDYPWEKPKWTIEYVVITKYNYGPPSNDPCCKGTVTPAYQQTTSGNPLQEFLWDWIWELLKPNN